MGLSPKSQHRGVTHSRNPGVPPPAAISRQGRVPPNTRDPQMPQDKDTPLYCPLVPLLPSPLCCPSGPAPQKLPAETQERLEGRPQPGGHRLTPPPPRCASSECSRGGGCAYLHPTGSWIADGTGGTHRALGTERESAKTGHPPWKMDPFPPPRVWQGGSVPLPGGPSLRPALLGRGDPAGTDKR